MFISESDARRRLESPRNLANRIQGGVEIRTIKLPGKKLGSKNLTVEERTEIAIEAKLGEKIATVARDHEVAEITVAKIKGDDGGQTDEGKVEEALGEVRDRALDRLMVTLGLLSNDKLSGTNAKDLSVIAANMGRVVDKVVNRDNKGTNVNVIVYAPELKKENAFESVEI